jgi:hypothetical protein
MGIRNHNISFSTFKNSAFPIIVIPFSKVSFWMVSITRQSFHTPARQRHNPLLLIPVLSQNSLMERAVSPINFCRIKFERQY